MADTIFNPSELIFKKAVAVSLMDYVDGKIFARANKLEEPSFTVTSETDEITDAEGATIASFEKNKKASMSASNSLTNLDLYAAQMGTSKGVASTSKKKLVSIEKTYTVVSNKITLDHTPKGEVKYIYKVSSGNLSEVYEVTAGSSPTEKQFTIATNTITLPADTTGTFLVSYDTEVDEAVYIQVESEKYPEICSARITAIFCDPCNQNIEYAGYIYAKKAKLDVSSVEMAWSRTGKHAFSLNFIKDYCEGNGLLFEFVVFKD